MGIDKKIYELRKKAGLSQEELGDKLNVSRQTISKWETGQSTPEIDKVTAICDLFGITTDDFLRDKTGLQEDVIDLNQTNGVDDKSKKNSNLIYAFIAFAVVLVGIPILDELDVSDNIEAALVAFGIAVCVYFLIKHFSHSKK